MTILAAHDIRKSYREGSHTVDVLRGVSLQVSAGEVVGLEGPSGSGKSTLLCILGCILTPSSGRLTIGGRVVGGDAEMLADARRRSIGFVFQHYNLLAPLSALENVEVTLELRGFARAEARRLAKDAIAAVGLEDRANFLPRDLSGGQKQRVAIARALAGNAPILLADEPTANLDSNVSEQILDVFRRLADTRSHGLLVVTHDARVRRICDRILTIRDGSLVHDFSHGVAS